MTDTKVENEIEAEVQARVDFKMNEFLTALKNTINNNYAATLQTGNPKYYYYWEAFVRLQEMVKKEMEMPVPYDLLTKESIDRKLKLKRDEVVEKLSNRLLKKGSYDYQNNQAFIANVIEELLKIQ